MTYTATIEYTATDREEAESAFQLMREAFCNQTSINEVFSTLVSTDARHNVEPIRLITNSAGVTEVR